MSDRHQQFSIKDIATKVFSIEKELSLFDKQIDGVYFWKLIRFSVFTKIAQHHGLYGRSQRIPYSGRLGIIKYIIKRIRNSYYNSFYSRQSMVDVLVFEHPRKVRLGDDYSDVYTKDIVDELRKQGVSFEVVDRPYGNNYYFPATAERSYGEDFRLDMLVHYLITYIKFTDEDKQLVEKVRLALVAAFDVDLDLKKHIRVQTKKFKARKKLLLQMLEKRAVKKVYLLVSYGAEALIAACQDLGIEAVELQHGVISKYHLGYSFPHNKSIPYFPDKLYLFGEYWRDSTPLPLPCEKTPVTGYPFFSEQQRKFQQEERSDKNVVFISQGTIGSQLSKYAVNLAKANPGLRFIYKLHPGEFGRWVADYPVLCEAKNLDNFSIIEDEQSLHYLLAVSKYVFAVYSTAIYEALAQGCYVLLVNLPGVEYCDYLYEKNYVAKVEITETDFNNLSLMEFTATDSNYFFAKPLSDQS